MEARTTSVITRAVGGGSSTPYSRRGSTARSRFGRRRWPRTQSIQQRPRRLTAWWRWGGVLTTLRHPETASHYAAEATKGERAILAIGFRGGARSGKLAVLLLNLIVPATSTSHLVTTKATGGACAGRHATSTSHLATTKATGGACAGRRPALLTE